MTWVAAPQEERVMALYLAELYLKEGFKRGYEAINRAMTEGFPPGVRLKAGPWASNEEAKVVLVMDIEDHTLTFMPFSSAVTQGIFAKRRLTPLVDWSVLEEAIGVSFSVE
jgi:hypothetical protein